MVVRSDLKFDLTLTLVGLLILGMGIVVNHYAKPSLEVENTFKAIEWAEENHIIGVTDSFTCEIAIGEYMKAHNLTPKEFPYYCWGDTAPMSLSEKVAIGLTIFGFLFTLAGGVVFTADSLKAFRKRERDGNELG